MAKADYLHDFLMRLRSVVGSHSPHDAILICPRMKELLVRAYDQSNLRGKSGGPIISERVLAQDCAISREQVRKRLRMLARYGLLKVHTAYNTRSKRWSSSEIIFNDVLAVCLQGNPIKASVLNRVLPLFVELWKRRLPIDEDVQGFWTDVAYGEEEPARGALDGPVAAGNTAVVAEEGAGATQAPQARVNALMAQTNAEAMKKQAQAEGNRIWADRAEKFVVGCGGVWNAGQQLMGRPPQVPIWEGKYAQLAPAAQKAFRELQRVFEHEGGFKAALGWYVFNGVKPGYDAKGNLIFDPKHPHRQWATADRQPAFFAKYFNAIMADADTIEFSKDPFVREQLEKAYPLEVLNSSPRWAGGAPRLYQAGMAPGEGVAK